jgi:hypothetical protein
MKNQIKNSIKYILLVVLLAACGPVVPSGPGGKSPTPTINTDITSTFTPTLTITNPVITNTVENSTVTPSATKIPVYQDGGGSNVITLDNNNQLITLHPNETFLLKLSEIYEWDWQIDNQTVASREINIAVIKGAQGVIKAHQSGTATLSASGDPLCRKQKPACGMPSILFTLHIEVLP